MNVLFLTADSLRADRTSLYGYDRDTTPFLRNLADRSVEFNLAYSNGFNTASSFPAVHASTHQSNYSGIGLPAKGAPTLAEVLHSEGYETSAIHTNELLSREYNYDRGFTQYIDSRAEFEDRPKRKRWRSVAADIVGEGWAFRAIRRAHFLSTEHLGVKLLDTADATSDFDDVIGNWVETAEDDWFIWAHYMNPHHPYEPPEECQMALGMDVVSGRRATRLSRKMRLHPDEVTAEESELIGSLYDASILSWDRELESTIRGLEESGHLDDTLVVVTADHGEMLGESGLYGHPPVLRQQLLRVPLLFMAPMLEPEVITDQVGLIDIPPTVATLVADHVPDEWSGRPLLDTAGYLESSDARPQFSEVGSADYELVACVDDDRKIVHNRGDSVWRSYDLHGELRFTETESARRFTDLRQRVRNHEMRTARKRQAGAAIDEDQLRQDLSALGYLDE